MKSMTAYAEASCTENQIMAEIVIRSYNSRYIDLALHAPESCVRFEDRIKKLVTKKIVRGRIEIRISLKDEREDAVEFQIDEKKAKAYLKALHKLKDFLSLQSEIRMDHLLNIKDIIKLEGKKTDPELVWGVVEKALNQAVDTLNLMRDKEGRNLVEDLTARMLFIEKKLNTIEEQAETVPEIYRQRLIKRIAALTSNVDGLDPVRLSQEAAILADKSDISEEIVRSRSHIKQFREIISTDEPVGRKLNFLIQEFNREFNTMGSKAGKVELSHIIVDVKSELEKIREQIQNIE